VDGYTFDVDQSFELSLVYRFQGAVDGGIVAVEIGPAGCNLEPEATRDLHVGYCHAGLDANGGFLNEIGPFDGEMGQNRTIRIRYSAPDRTFVFFHDDMTTGHTIAVDEEQLRMGERLLLRVHDIRSFFGGAHAVVDWIEFRHLADDEVVL
jgi:hypothetical protein